MPRLIGEFAKRLPARIQAMQAALANGHHEELQLQAHQLKGAGGSYGHPSLTRASAALEDAAKARDAEAAKIALNRLTTACQTIAARQVAKTA